MPKISFVGSAYQDRSVNVNNQTCINLFPEIDNSGARNVLALYPTPGLELFSNIGLNPVRGLHVVNNVLYAVVYNKLYKVLANGTYTEIGTLNSFGNSSEALVSMKDNGTQLIIVDGVNGYIYNTNTPLFSQITSAGFPNGAKVVDFLDGYFIVNKPNTGSFQISTLYDGLTWDALDIATAEGDPDNLASIINDHSRLWLFGEYSTEIWYDAGTYPFPLQRVQGAFLEWGCLAPFSVAKMDNSIFWLAQTPNGKCTIVRASGSQPTIISTPAIDYQLSLYPDAFDAQAYTYMDSGHSFYVITFPSANVTWVYDSATNLWHQRSSYEIGRHRGNVYAYFAGQHIIGDCIDGKLHRMKNDVYTETENKNPIIRTRRTQHLFDPEGKNIIIDRLKVEAETGVGLTNDLIVYGDWTSRTSTADNGWNSVTYGNGLFVAVAYTGTGNRVMTSPDGITWTIRTSAADNNWRGVTYGNGLFVAVSITGTGNRVMTSPDGITWTIRTSAADNDWYSVTYGNGLFVAVAGTGTGNRVMTSPDGITWTTRTSAADNDWLSVTYGNGLFVAVSNTGTGNRVMASFDGITWTTRTSAADNSWRGVTYGNGLFVAVAYSGVGNRVMTSPDGITWTTRTSAADNQWYSVTYGNGLFVAVSITGTGNRVMASFDGITWTIRTSAADNNWYSVTYGNGLFVAVAGTGIGNRVMASPGSIVIGGSNPQAWLKYSTDGGHTWSNELWVDMGKIGEYNTIMEWRRLGRGRNWVFELGISDPIKTVIIDANADIRRCNN